MNDALNAYRIAQQRRGLSPETISRRKHTCWQFESWLRKPILDADPDDIERWLDTLDLSARSRYSYLSNLHCFFEFAVRRGYVKADPTENIDRPKLPRSVPRPVSDDDLAYALSVAPPRERAMVCLGAFQGLRCKEIAGLAREDVLEHEAPPLLVVTFGKGNRQRVLPLNEQVEMALRLFGMPKRGPVFRKRDGTRLAPYTVGQIVSTFLRDIGVEASCHQLRHAFASRVYRETSDLRLTQELLGHSSPQTTAIYAAWNPKKAAEVVRRMTAKPSQESLL